MTKIHVLVAQTNYECDDMICAYADKSKAEKEARRLNLLLSSHPQCPDQGDSDFFWNQYNAKLAKWRKKFKHAWCDNFDVRTLKLKQ